MDLTEKVFFRTALESYKEDPPQTVGGENTVELELFLNGQTMDVYVNHPHKIVLIAVRGTVGGLNGTDWKANRRLLINRLVHSRRFQQDKKVFDVIRDKFPYQQGWMYFMSGHSLGSAIVMELKRQYPFIKEAVSYNGAFQSLDLNNQQPDVLHRYVSKDPLYHLGGKYFKNKIVIPFNPPKATSFFERLLQKAPIQLQAHSITEFEPMYASTQPVKVVRSFVERKRS